MGHVPGSGTPGKKEYMHRHLMTPGSVQQNTWNNQGNRDRKNSRFPGVYRQRGRKSWIAQIGYCGRTYYIGSFKTEEQANRIRIRCAQKLRGGFAPQVSSATANSDKDGYNYPQVLENKE